MGRLITKKSECFGHFPLLIDVKERISINLFLKKQRKIYCVPVGSRTFGLSLLTSAVLTIIGPTRKKYSQVLNTSSLNTRLHTRLLTHLCT